MAKRAAWDRDIVSSNPTSPTQWRILLCSAILFFFCSSASALNFNTDRPVAGKTITSVEKPLQKAARSVKRLLARVTVYWPKEDRWSRRHQSSTGVRLHRNVVAVDPHIIPYGSRVRFPDGLCHAVDTGAAVKNRKAAIRSGRTVEEKAACVVDRFFETKREALVWANTHPPFMALDILPLEQTF